MHSSRVCTAHLLILSCSIPCILGGGFASRGVLHPGGSTSMGSVSRGVCMSSPVNRMTDRCKNIALPQTSFAGSNHIPYHADQQFQILLHASHSTNRGCEQTQPEVSAFWRGKENFVHKRFFIKYRQINIFKVKNTILYKNCILWAPTAYEKYCCHPLKIEKFVPNGKPLKYRHSRVGKCH